MVTEPTDLAVEMVALEQLTELRGNPRRGNVDSVVRSYRQFGQRKPIVARHLPDGRGEVIAGNHQLLAARELGWSEMAVVWFDGTDAQVRAFALADNRTSDLGTYDEAALTDLLEEIAAYGDKDLFDATSYSEKDLFGFLARRKDGRTDPDAVPEAPAESVTAPADLWVLGNHRLICGDSTDPAVVSELMAGERSALMATDPPYLVDYQGGNHPQSWHNHASNRDKHWDDYVDPETSSDFFAAFLRAALAEALNEAPAVYQWHASRRYPEIAAAWEANGLLCHQQLIWVKSRAVLGRGHFMWRHEPCVYGWRHGHVPARRPPTNTATVWEVNQQGESDGIHPTQKPVELFRRPIEWHTEATDVVYEPFGGSGTTLIAAEMLGRRCHAVELSPAFVDVICRRFQQFTGTLPVRAGEPVDFEAL